MKNIIIAILTIALIGLVLFLAVTFMQKSDYNSEKFFLSDWALTADNHLTIASTDLEKASYDASARNIETAINEMKSIEAITDSEGVNLVENAIDHLIKVEEEIKLNITDTNQLEDASIQALNTLALVHLKLSDELAKEGANTDAMKSIRIAIKHLQNAVEMAHLGSQRVGERLVIDELNILLDSLEKNGHLDKKEYTISANDLVKLIKSN